jgi:hypothetical protein
MKAPACAAGETAEKQFPKNGIYARLKILDNNHWSRRRSQKHGSFEF